MVLTITAHALGGGALPDLGLTVLVTVLFGGVGFALADRRRGPLAILAVLATGQALTHAMLVWLNHSHAAGHVGVLSGPRMLLAHAAVTGITALLLAKAESLIFLVAGALAAAFPARPPHRAVRSALWVATESGTGGTISTRSLFGAQSRRGPPRP